MLGGLKRLYRGAVLPGLDVSGTAWHLCPLSVSSGRSGVCDKSRTLRPPWPWSPHLLHICVGPGSLRPV